jgi:Trk-type K+ transport system membrane component
MAQPGYENRPVDVPVSGDAAPKVSAQRARQGQNIKGMLYVLVLGILLVAIAYAVMLALQAEPTSVVNESRTEAAAATQGLAPGETQGQAQPETAPSPQ